MAPTTDPRRADEATINLFHPIYHSHTYPIGCRVDLERILPPSLDEFDAEELVDNFSEPPIWIERFSPVAAQVGDQVYRGKNYSDLMLKVYRLMFDLFQGIGRFIDSTMAQSQSAEGGETIRFPFMSLCVDPDTLHRLIESDFESGDTTYSNLMKLYSEGTLTPCLTTPFHLIMPLLKTDAEIRLCVRSSLIFYLRLMRSCKEFLARNGENGLLVVPFWLPEGGYSERVLKILEEEFQSFCQKQKLGQSHLVVLLDNHQVVYGENDVLMKSWNLIECSNGHGKNGRNGKNGRSKGDKGKELNLHDGVGSVSVVFRDRVFSDWVIHANPSVKKLLDRTIAKVDSDINGQNVHYGWAHYEELEAITYSPRAIVNFQQKLVKLTELGYLPLSPDFYVRGKLRGEFGFTTKEPLMVRPLDVSIGNGWDKENSRCLCRWLGCKDQPSAENLTAEIVARAFDQPSPEGPVKKTVSGAWKLAWNEAREHCYSAVVGNLETLQGGMAEILGELTGMDDPDKARRNVEDFLAHYTYVYWREHFIQHDLAEADINIIETGNKYLRAGNKTELEPEEAAIAGAAAQAIYFALDSGRSQGLAFENMDQRAFYQNVTMLTLAMSNAMYVYHWRDDKRSARKLLGLLQTELLDFETAYERHGLEARGISKNQWKQCIKSEVAENKDNLVRRATLRVAARHLRPLGYTKEFTRNDANVTTNVGHVWSYETGRENFVYENQQFCGVSEA